MTKFRFSLGRVLDWRRRQEELEEQRLTVMLAELRRIESAHAELAGNRRRAREDASRGSPQPHELWTLAAYLDRSGRGLAELAQRIQEHSQRITAQRERLLQARRKCQLLEKLKEARRSDWQREADREWEQAAAEAHLSRWKPAS